MIKIAIVDDHPIVVEGITELLRKHPDISVIHTAKNGEEIIAFLHEQQVDVVLMDINMPGKDGISSTKIIKAKFPKTKVIIFTMYNETSYMRSLVSAGADGCVLKTKGKEELIEAIMKVTSDGLHFETLAENTAPRRENELSDREKEVVAFLLQGVKTRDIAERLHISELTVRTHQKNVYRKIKVNNITELANYALNHSLLK